MKNTVLIVDDNTDNLSILFNYLRKANFKVLVAESGKSALKRIKYLKPDIILLDIMMPDMDGFETCRRLKSDEESKDIPVIFMTALTETVDKVKGFEVGSVDYITKPVQVAEVVARLNTHLTIRNLQNTLSKRNKELETENEKRRQTEIALQQAKELLEEKVKERTFELEKANANLKEEITERQRAEEALRLTQFTVDNAANAIFWTKLDGQFFYVNKEAIHYLKYSHDELLSMSIFDIEPKISADILPIHGKVLQELGSTVLETNYRRKDGSIFPVEVTENYIRFNDVNYLCFSVRDITERKQTQEELRKHRIHLEVLVAERTEELAEVNVQLQRNLHFLEVLMDTIPTPLFYKDKEGKYLGCNTAFANFVGKKPKELVGKTVYDVWEKDKADVYYEADQGLIQQKGKKIYESQMIYWNGSYRDVIFNKATFLDINGEVGGIVGTFTDITKRKQVAEALRKSEERFDLAMRGTNDGIWDWNIEADTMYLSPRWKEIIGFADHEIPNHFDEWSSRRIHSEDFIPMIENTVAYLDKKTPSYEHIYRLQHKDEHYVWILMRGIAVWDEQEQPVRMVGTCMDLTAQKQAEEALQQNEERMRRYFEQPLIGMATYSLSKGFLEVNDKLCDMLGYTRKELIHHDWAKLTHPDDFAIDTEQLNRIIAGKIDSYSREKRYIRKDGKIIDTSIAVHCVRDTDGRVDHFVALVQNITKRKQAEAKLQAVLTELNQFKTTLDMTLDCVFMFNAKTLKYFYVNQGAIEHIGYTQEELFQKTPLDIKPEFTGEQFNTLINMLLDGSQSVQRFETVHQHKNGTLIPVDIFLQYIQVAGQTNRFVAIVRDITERKQVEAQLQKAIESAEQAKFEAETANRAKSAFLTSMSHELRTPLHGILGYTQILNFDETLTEGQKEGIQIIQRSGEHLLMLINDILDLAKIEAGKLGLVPTDFRLQSFLKDIVDLFRMRAEQKGIEIGYEQIPPADSIKTLETEGFPLIVHVDEKRLRQILLNLLSNAIKFTEKGRVGFKVVYHNNKIRFEVEDTGIGIAVDQIKDIFLPFQQVNQHIHQIEGTGLGLPISKRLVEMMGGHLQVESLLGEGTLFWFEIALKVVKYAENTRLHKKSTIADIVSYKRLQSKNNELPITVLVVDDIWENRLVLTTLLTPLGFKVLEANNGREALDKIQTFHPDIIVMDLKMPVMDGFECTKRIRQDINFKETIIIALSASVFGSQQQESLEAGCNAFLSKPINIDKFLQVLATHCSLKWIYKTPKNEDLLTTDSSTQIIPPNAEQTTQLFKFAKSGDVQAVITNAKALLENDPNLQLFVNEVCQLAKGFKMSKLKNFLEQYMT
ncbi:PAS domain S-box protein [Candidatus Parabeggiatoa sp. HSG14]|uniref:PAS domain S-box protein n=1 Tax=Candidatus Parabeggiatoa sp. HSG14 TaxID=3055593 RepID=UPI0025A71839|nr:PAS domain S-box protein [Thiotrichales bacterium HSG14]